MEISESHPCFTAFEEPNPRFLRLAWLPELCGPPGHPQRLLQTAHGGHWPPKLPAKQGSERSLYVCICITHTDGITVAKY
jgi:hypothetical protein